MYKDVLQLIKILYNKGFFPAASGNVSFKLQDNLIAITPTSRSKIFLKEDDFSIIDFNGKVINSNRPSSEYRLHLNVYKNTDAKIVLHAHPEYSTLITTYPLDIADFNEKMLYETRYNLKYVSLIPYKFSGTKELADAFTKDLKKGIYAYLIKSHGILVYSDSVEKVLNLAESLEFYSFIYFNRFLVV